MHVEACVDPLLDALALLFAPQRALPTRRAGTSLLDAWLTYELFRYTVAYEPHCQGLWCMWVAEDG